MAHPAASLPLEHPHTIKKALARVMLSQGATYREIHLRTGLANDTITQLKKGGTAYNQALVDELTRSENGKLTLAIHTHLDESLSPEKIEKTNSYQHTLAAAILVDKRELLAGRATVRVGQEIPDTDLRAKIEALEAELVVDPIVTDSPSLAIDSYPQDNTNDIS